MMDARRTLGDSIGDVATFAHLHGTNMGMKKKIAPVAAKPLATMMGSGAAAAPIAPAAVSSGSKSHQGEATTRMEITLTFVLSGLQPPAPMASPSL